MFYIALCDDDASDLQRITEYVKSYLNNEYVEACIKTFKNGEELLDSVFGDEMRFHIVILDIHMKELTGIDTAKKILAMDPSCIFVFLTSSKEYVFESYEIGAVHYLVKPIDESKLHKALQRSFNLIKDLDQTHILVKNNNTLYKVLLKDIVFIESKARLIRIHRAGIEPLVFYNKLDDFEKDLNDKRFLRCHKSYLINMEHVEKISGASFHMNNGSMVPISKNINSVKNEYMTFLMNKMENDAARRKLPD